MIGLNFLSNLSKKNTQISSFETFANYILQNANHGEKANNKVHIIIDYPKISWDNYAEYMATLTWYTGIPMDRGGARKNHVIFAKDIDSGLAQAESYDFAIISYIGSFYYTEHDRNIHIYFDQFCEKNIPCQGHLLFHPHKQYGRLHPQTIFLNLKHWRYLHRPSFGYYSGEVVNYERSKQNIHDDYTPLWIKKGEGTKKVVYAEQAEYISKVLADGHVIPNFIQERNVKFFCYPERRYSEALKTEQNKPADIIYVENNEKYPKKPKWYTKKFDRIYCPASGFIAEYLYKIVGHANTELIIFDYNANSLLWKKMFYSMATTNKDLDFLAHYFAKKGCIISDCNFKEKTLAYNNEKFSRDELLEIKQKITPTFVHQNIVEDIIEVDPFKKNFIYVSNIFSFSFLMHKHRIEYINNQFSKYLELPNTTIVGSNAFRSSVWHES